MSKPDRFIVNSEIGRLIDNFQRVKHEKHVCSDPLCMTCGGYWKRVYESLTDQDKQSIKQLLEVMEVSDLGELGEYSSIFRRVEPDGYVKLLARAKDDLRTANLEEVLFVLNELIVEPDSIEARSTFKTAMARIGALSRQQLQTTELDHLIFALRGLLRSGQYHESPFTEYVDEVYAPLLRFGAEHAVASRDRSLAETVILGLGEKAAEFDELVSIALKFAKTNRQMQRVLYNCLREVRDDVRGFEGDGASHW